MLKAHLNSTKIGAETTTNLRDFELVTPTTQYRRKEFLKSSN